MQKTHTAFEGETEYLAIWNPVGFFMFLWMSYVVSGEIKGLKIQLNSLQQN